MPGVEGALARLQWRWSAAGDADFPAGLAATADPPLGLFLRGSLPQARAVALVGARRATAYGREVAEYLGRELAAAGVAVVSGMARGVDAAAHRGALAGGGGTVAVWGAGPDRVYPPEHAELAGEIAAAGCLLTEYPPGAPPLAHHFPERNRLIAGLAEAVVVIEADERSGALITARLALDEGREVLAVPGSVFSRLSAGPNGLLRAGAAPVLSADDVLAAIGLPPRAAAPGGPEPALLALIPAGEAVTVDRLAAASGQPVAQVLEGLLALELAGRVARETDGRYRRSRVTG
ncbi:MAG: DNA-processing protein DprA [Thermoanaerobaculaceae bacterium]|nr:DNA-processing protein DprA [Thermoanaerobaculaceae bacterium]